MTTSARPRITKLTCAIIVAVFLIVVIGVGALVYSRYQGRAVSRVLGITNHVALPECVHRPTQVLGISFHQDRSGQTIKDVTYVCDDGRIYSEEYNDFGVFQGKIEWTYKSEPAK